MAAQPVPVLLVEDNPGDARLIEIELAEAAPERFALTRAEELAPALDRLAAGRFGVVLLDLMLPDSQGLDTFQALTEAAPEVPVVVLTGLADESLGVRAVQQGAQDYLVKGQVDGRHLAHALHYAMRRHGRHHAIEERLKASEAEITAARCIQQHLFPCQAPACPGYDMHGATECATAAGDFFDYLSLPGGRVGIVVGDVTGHGVGPALLMAATRAYLRAFAHTGTDLGGILSRTNHILAEDMADGRNVTLLLGQLETDPPGLVYASAGHETGYVVSRCGEIRSELYSTGLPLGIVPEIEYRTALPVPLEAGDVVAFWTDGVVEAHCPGGEMFGRTRALDVVRRYRECGPQEIVSALFEAVRDHLGGRPAPDDMTAVVVKVQTGPPE
jgi:serine phosphatase RsbU (regulator of sigma subunit)